MTKNVDTNCKAFKVAVDVLARPWAAAVLNVLQTGERRFSEIAEACHGVGDKVLSARLKDLEQRGLVTRHVDPGPPIRVSYELTKSGRAFSQVAEAIERWGRELAAGEPKQKPNKKSEKHSARWRG